MGHRVALVLWGLAMAACGAPPGERLYVGTSTSTVTCGGAQNVTTTKTNTSQLVAPSGLDPTKWVFYGGGTDFAASLNGETLSFASGQQVTDTEGGIVDTTSLTSGSGTMNSQTLTLNLTVTTTHTSGGSTTTSTTTAMFNGQRQ